MAVCSKKIERLHWKVKWQLACENIRFSSLFATGDVSQGGTSATQRQKVHTEDVKSVGIRSEALIGRRSSYVVLAIVYEWQTEDKRPQRSNVNAKNLEQNNQYLWNILFSSRSVWVLLELVGRWTKHCTKIDQKTRKNWTNLYLKPHDYRTIL